MRWPLFLLLREKGAGSDARDSAKLTVFKP
jgi:hypothetical protein